jgi:peptide/nickel transport system permease protein
LQAYILRRVLISLPLLLLIAVSTFVFINLAPGDAIDAMIDPQELEAGAKDLERLREAMGLNRSVPERFVVWLGQIARGNLGYSYYTGEPVLSRISAKMLPTLELTATAMILSTVLGTIFGIIAALKQYSMYDYTLGIASLFGVSIPTFFFALLALYLFAFVWEIFPSHGMGYVPGEGLSFRLNIYHLLLPALVLSIDTMAGKTRYARTAMLEVLKADYVTTARAKGLPEQVVVLRHGFRNALIPLITVTMLRLQGPIAVQVRGLSPGLVQERHEPRRGQRRRCGRPAVIEAKARGGRPFRQTAAGRWFPQIRTPTMEVVPGRGAEGSAGQIRKGCKERP